MKPENCPKLDECHKVKKVLDKDTEDFQYDQSIREVCANYPGPEQIVWRRNDGNR